jgi:uncharacterized iron-regulated protein
MTACTAAGAETPAKGAGEAHRCGFWIDLYSGEPIEEEELLDDLAGVRVVYLGERHSLLRHHELEAWIASQLAKRKIPLVVGLEQMEAIHQPTLDRYAKGELSFAQLAETTQWAKRWRDYQQYQPVLEAARQAHSPFLALNARTETVRQVARGGGVERLDPAIRRELPPDVQLKDPPYEKLLGLQMMVHAAATPGRLRPMIEAQIVRDEVMAFVLASFLQSPSGKGRTAVVLCGSVHVAYGLGTAARVRRRMPGVKDRILHFSESGDVELSPEELAMARPITITHEQLRELALPFGDYLHATSLKAAAKEEDESRKPGRPRRRTSERGVKV